MTTLTRWMPLAELPIERRMRRMLDDIGFGPFMVPAADFYETGDDFVIELEAPGFDEKELGIEVSDHTLTIEGSGRRRPRRSRRRPSGSTSVSRRRSSGSSTFRRRPTRST